MPAIQLEGSFRVWQYGVGHSQLLLHRRRSHKEEPEDVSVLFEDVRAVKLRAAYSPLTLHPADGADRTEILEFAGIPDRLQSRFLALTLPTERDGFVVCGRAAVLAVGASDELPTWWPAGARVIRQLRPSDMA